MSIVIGFGYMNRSGKDSAAAEIIKKRNPQYDVRRYAFADELKRECNEAIEKAGSLPELFYQMDEQLPEWVQLEADIDMTDPLCPYGKCRTLLQWWGSEYRREQEPLYWVTRMAERLYTDRPQVALITDMRFPNEMGWIRNGGHEGYVVRVDRPEGPPGTGHHSEKQLRDLPDLEWDVILTNREGQLEKFKEDAVKAFDLLVMMGLGRQRYIQSKKAA